MKNDSSKKARWPMWVVVMVAVLVLYVITFPPIYAIGFRKTWKSWVTFSAHNALTAKTGNWLVTYREPYVALASAPFLKVPMNAYWQWWAKQLLGPFAVF